MRPERFLTIVTAWVALLACSAAGSVYELYPSSPNWYDVLSGSELLPGDEVILHGGLYSSSSWLPMGHQGTAEDPIIIRAAEGETPIISKSNTTKNGIDVMGARYLVLQGLEVTGCSSGIRIYENAAGQDAQFITIEDCHVHHTVGNAITCNHGYQTYEGMIFRGNEIDHTGGHGEGFYLGSNNDATGETVSVFFNGLIEKNYIHDLVGGTIDQGDGIEIKDGSYNNIVRDNVIINTNYPGIIVYGTDGNAPNIVERNVVINTNDNGIQAAAEAVVRNNIVMNAAADGIHSHHHQSAVPGNLTIVHNTLIQPYGADTVGISSDAGNSGPIVVANNALYSAGGSGLNFLGVSVTQAGNVVSTNLSADFADVANWDFFPIPGSALIAGGSLGYVVEEDFNGTSREGIADAGAYRYNPHGNPGWAILPGFKVIPVPDGDANTDGAVDGADYTIWADHYKLAGGWHQGDFNDDGIVDGADYTIWADNFQAGGGSNLPEPAAMLLIGVGAAMLLRRRARPH